MTAGPSALGVDAVHQLPQAADLVAVEPEAQPRQARQAGLVRLLGLRLHLLERAADGVPLLVELALELRPRVRQVERQLLAAARLLFTTEAEAKAAARSR